MSFGAFPPSQRRRVVVTGIGMVTPLGSSTQATWSALLAGTSAGRPLREVPFLFPASVLSRGEAATSKILASLPCQVAYPVIDGGDVAYSSKSRFAPTSREPRCHRFALTASEEALSDAQLLLSPSPGGGGGEGSATSSSLSFDATAVQRDRVAVNIGMGITSMTDIEETTQLLYSGAYNKVHPFFVPKILGNMPAAAVAIRYGFTGPIGSAVAACATGAQCIGEAARCIQEGTADVAVCGATESALTPVSIAGFCRMKAMSTAFNNDPAASSRPFDAKRNGFVMGEGAGMLILESLDSAIRRKAPRIYAELRGFGCCSDSYHVSSPHPEGIGAKGCVRAALYNAGTDVSAKHVLYVNAHATGTPMGDDIELNALANIFENNSQPVVVSSSKGALGHLLGAAGSVEAAITVLALHHRTAPPNVNMDEPISIPDGARVSLNREAQSLTGGGGEDRCATISTSFGFGGVNTALVFTNTPR